MGSSESISKELSDRLRSLSVGEPTEIKGVSWNNIKRAIAYVSQAHNRQFDVTNFINSTIVKRTL